METPNFPIISFQPFLSGTEAEKSSVAQQLYDAFHTFGWVYLKDFGISAEEIDEMFLMVSMTVDETSIKPLLSLR
jgi:isopenicillin N synthase-like dioxygenase